MSKLLKESLRKTVAGIVAFATILSLSGVIALAPVAQAATIADGALVKSNAVNSDGTPTYASLDVYIVKLVGAKKFKRLMLNPAVLTSYGHLAGATVNVVDQATMDSYTTSGLVRVDTDPAQKVFALAPNDDIGSKSWVNVTTDQFVTQAGADPESVYTINSVDGGNYTAVADVTTVAQVQTFLTLGTLPSVTPVAGGLTVALAADTPASGTHASGTAYNSVLKLNLTAGNDGAVNVTSLKLTRGGVSIDSNISGIAVFDAAGVRHGNFVTFASTKASISFASSPITIPAGQTVPITVKTNVSGTSGTYYVSVAQAADIGTTATVSGTFPTTGSVYSMASGALIVGTLTADAVLVHDNGANDVTAVSVNLGTINQEIARFRFVAGANEDIKISKITMYNNGNTNDADVQNIKLVAPDGTVLATVLQATNRNVEFNLASSPYTIAKGNTKDLSVRIDLVGGSTRNVRFVIQNDYDIEVVGKDTNSGILATAATTVDGAFPIGDTSAGGANCASGVNCINKLTVSAGTATFNKASDSLSGNIAVGATGVVLGKWNFTPNGEDMEIRQVAYTLTRTVALTGTFTINVDGATVYSVAPASMGATGVKTTVTLNSYPTLKAGVKSVFTLVGDISTSASSGVTYLAALDIMQVKRIATNDLVDPSATDTSANTLTVSTAALSVNKNASFPNAVVVAGLSDAKIGSYNLSASATEDVGISSITVGLTNITNVSNLILKVGATQYGSAINTPAASNVISISGLTVAKGTSATLDVYLSTNSATTGTEISSITAVSATGKNSGNTLSVTGLTTTGQTVTLSTGGTLAMVLDTTNTPVGQILHSGLTDYLLLAARLTAGVAEAVKVTNIQLTAANGDANLKDIKLFVDGVQKGSTVQLVKGVALFSDTAGLFTIDQDSTKILYVKGSTTTSGTINSQSTANLAIDYIEGIGVSGSAKIKPGTTLATIWATTTAAITSADLTVGDTTGFHKGDVIYAASNVGGGSGSLGIVLTEPTSTTTLTVAVMTAVTANAAGTITKIASGAWTVSDNSDNPDISAVDTTVTSTKSFNVGDAVIYSTGTDVALGYVTAISSGTQMSIASLENIAGNVDIVAKIGTDTLTTTSNGTVATADTVVAGQAEIVASTAGFSVGDMVLAVDTVNAGSIGIITAIGTSTSMTVSTQSIVYATGGTTVTYVRVGAVNPSTTLVSSAASAGAAVVEGVAHTVTSSTGFGVGDMVISQHTAGGPFLGRITVVTDATTMTVASSTADAGLDARITRLPGAASASKLFTIHDVEPVISNTTGFIGGSSTPTNGQEVGKFDIKADGDRNLSISAFHVKMGGSNFPWKYVNSYDLYAGSTLLSSATNTIGTVENDAGTWAITGSSTTIKLCNVTTEAGAANELGLIGLGGATGTIMKKIRAGDVIGFFISSTAYVTYTVTSATVGIACTEGDGDAGDVTLVVSGGNAVGTINDDGTPILYDFNVSFDTNSATALPTQTVTAGSTVTYTVKADTTNVKTGVTSGTVNYNVAVSGTQGSTGDLTWAYTPSGGSAISSTTISDSYPVNGPTFTY